MFETLHLLKTEHNVWSTLPFVGTVFREDSESAMRESLRVAQLASWEEEVRDLWNSTTIDQIYGIPGISLGHSFHAGTRGRLPVRGKTASAPGEHTRGLQPFFTFEYYLFCIANVDCGVSCYMLGLLLYCNNVIHGSHCGPLWWCRSELVKGIHFLYPTAFNIPWSLNTA